MFHRNLLALAALLLSTLVASVSANAQSCWSQVRFHNIDCGCDIGTYTETFVIGEPDAMIGYQDGNIECGFGGCFAGYVQSCNSSGKLRKPPALEPIYATHHKSKFILIAGASLQELSKDVPICGTDNPRYHLSLNVQIIHRVSLPELQSLAR